MSSSGLNVQNNTAALGLVAGTTQTAAGATALTGGINSVTSGNDDDGVILPAAQPQGTVIYIANIDSGQDIDVWPNTGATINGGTATSGVVVVGQTQGLICVQAGTDGLTWLALLGAVCAAA